MKLSVALAIVCTGLTSPFALADWPQFRGPSGQGTSEVSGLPVSWSDSENVAWKTPIAGLGWSSHAIVDDRIYVTTAVDQGEETRSLRVLCIGLGTGSVEWDKEIFLQKGAVQMHGKNSHASPTPLIDGEHVYVHFGPHGTACLTLAGETVWKTNKIEYQPRHGTGGSPALVDGKLIICCDGYDIQYVVAVNAKTGEIDWKVDRDTEPVKGFSFCTPQVIEINGQNQAICPGSDAVFAYEPQTGKEIWRLKYPGYSVVPRPVYANGLVFICTGYDQSKLLAIDPTGTGDVTTTHLKWTLDRGAPHNPSPVVLGENLYMVSDGGIASCVNCQTGKVNWQERVGGAYSASLLATPDRIYIQDEDGTAIVIQPGTEFTELARNKWTTGERTFASFAVAGKSLILRSEGHLLKIDDQSTAAK